MLDGHRRRKRADLRDNAVAIAAAAVDKLDDYFPADEQELAEGEPVKWWGPDAEGASA